MSPVLYEETLFGTALLYNLGMPALTPGFRYAWRVKAVSTTGLSENAVFKNDGYSEIYSFKYTPKCNAPTFTLSEVVSPGSVKITWQGTPDQTKYQVQYRKKSIAETNKRGKTKEKTFEWFSAYSLNNQVLLTNLETETQYEFRVGASCTSEAEGIQGFTYSNTNTFIIPKKENSIASYNCGIKPNINISNQTPLTNLIQSETFKAGDFPVTILELQGQNSPYSGRGYIIVPYLADTKIAVEFKDIVINTDYQLISGVVETAYDAKWGNVIGNSELLADNNIADILNSLTNAVETLKDLLNKEKVEDKKEWDEIYNKNKGIVDEGLKLISKSGNLPQNMQDQITKTAGNTYLVSNDKAKPPTIEDFPEAKKETLPIADIIKSVKDTEDGLQNLLQILKNLAANSFIKCQKCEGQKIEKLGGFDGSNRQFHKLSYYNKAYVCLIASLKKNKEINILTDNLAKSSSKIAKARPDLTDLIEATKTIFNNKQDLLAVISNNSELVSCNVIYPFNKKICGGANAVDDETLLNVSKELETCYYGEYLPKLLAGNLKEITLNSRKNQGIEYVKDGKVYKLNGDVAEEVKNALTDDDIRNGKWIDATIDVKIRITQNKDGVFEYQAVGIRSTLAVASGKTAKLKDLAAHIESKGNTFFQKYKVIKADFNTSQSRS